MLVGSSGAEDSASAHLTSVLNNPPVNAPTLQLDPVGSSGATGLSPRGHAPVHLIAPTPVHRFIRCTLVFFHQCCKLHQRLLVGLSGANWMHRCLCIGSSGATVNCRTRPFHSFFEFFLRGLLCLAFLLHPWDLLIFT